MSAYDSERASPLSNSKAERGQSTLVLNRYLCHVWNMIKAPFSLNRKQTRTIERAMSHLTRNKSFIDVRSIEDLKAVSITHELHLPDGSIKTLSDSGLEQLETMVLTVHNANAFRGLADHTDLWNVSKKTFAELSAANLMPKTAQEWLRLLSAKLAPEIRSRTFVIPFVGIELDGIDELALGPYKIIRPSISFLEQAGIDHRRTDVPSKLQSYRSWELWLTGSVLGTHRVAESHIRTQSVLIAGLIAVVAATILSDGATNLFISPNMTGHDTDGRATWFSWGEAGSNFTLHSSKLRGLPFPIDSNLRSQLVNASYIMTAMRIFQSEKRTPLEEAVTRGFHWFADAHRDPTQVMQLVKYWSCIETLFSSDREGITRSLSVGVASVLVFGGYEFAKPDDYKDLKKRVAKLYDLRSQAVHQASRNHVKVRDVAELSKFTGQLLLNALSFIEDGYQTPAQIKAHSQRLDAVIETHGRETTSL